MRHMLVIAASLITFVIPNVVGLGFWVLADGLDPEIRSLTAILVWVAAFGFSTQVFWRVIQKGFRRNVE